MRWANREIIFISDVIIGKFLTLSGLDFSI